MSALSDRLTGQQGDVVADLVAALLAAEGSIYQALGEAIVRQISGDFVTALCNDIVTGRSAHLNTVLRHLSERFGQYNVRFHDLRLLATTMRRRLLAVAEVAPPLDAAEFRALEDWLFQVPIQSAISFIRRSEQIIQQQHSDLEVKAAEARSLLEQRETMLTEQQRLIDLLGEVSLPIVPILEHVLVVPLVGHVNQDRAEGLMERLLNAIAREQATVIILDISGVPLFDTHVAHALMQTAQASMLLGARVILVGVSSEIAQTVVSLQINLEHVVTRATLQEGLEYALKLQRLKIVPDASSTSKQHTNGMPRKQPSH